MSGKAQYHRDISRSADLREITSIAVGFVTGVGIGMFILALIFRLF